MSGASPSGLGNWHQLAKDLELISRAVPRNADRLHLREVFLVDSRITIFWDVVVRFLCFPSPPMKMWKQFLSHMASLDFPHFPGIWNMAHLKRQRRRWCLVICKLTQVVTVITWYPAQHGTVLEVKNCQSQATLIGSSRQNGLLFPTGVYGSFQGAW